MPVPDGRITLRIDDNEAQVLLWAIVYRIRLCTDLRKEADGQEQQLLENEIVQLGSLLNKLPTFKYSKGDHA